MSDHEMKAQLELVAKVVGDAVARLSIPESQKTFRRLSEEECAQIELNMSNDNSNDGSIEAASSNEPTSPRDSDGNESQRKPLVVELVPPVAIPNSLFEQERAMVEGANSTISCSGGDAALNVFDRLSIHSGDAQSVENSEYSGACSEGFDSSSCHEEPIQPVNVSGLPPARIAKILKDCTEKTFVHFAKAIASNNAEQLELVIRFIKRLRQTKHIHLPIPDEQLTGESLQAAKENYKNAYAHNYHVLIQMIIDLMNGSIPSAEIERVQKALMTFAERNADIQLDPTGFKSRVTCFQVFKTYKHFNLTEFQQIGEDNPNHDEDDNNSEESNANDDHQILVIGPDLSAPVLQICLEDNLGDQIARGRMLERVNYLKSLELNSSSPIDKPSSSDQ